jgi:hypothetical protein
MKVREGDYVMNSYFNHVGIHIIIFCYFHFWTKIGTHYG